MTTTKSSRPGQAIVDAQPQSAASAENPPPATSVAKPTTSPRAGFDLAATVRDVLRTSESADLDVITKEVLDRIPKRHRAEALRQTLRVYVQRGVTAERAQARTPAQSPPTSWKVAGIREGWRRRLHDRPYVNGERKFLRDCTYDDLQTLASDYEELAKANSAAAREVREWARALTEHGVETLGDLPAEVLARLLGRAAA